MTKRKDYGALLKVAYELEGLLLLQSNRQDAPSADIDKLIDEKINYLSQSMTEEKILSADDANNLEHASAPVSGIGEETPQEWVEDTIESVPEPTEAEESSTGEDAVTSINDVIETPLSLEEKLAKERARDIFGAFTLNDKFRFRRELFHNSQDEFDDALNIISQMSSIEEAEEYIYDDLCWSADNDDVKAFMEVVSKHF